MGKAAHSKLGQYSPDGELRNDIKQEAESFSFARYILLSEHTPAIMLVSHRKQNLPFIYLGLSSKKGDSATMLQILRVQ